MLYKSVIFPSEKTFIAKCHSSLGGLIPPIYRSSHHVFFVHIFKNMLFLPMSEKKDIEHFRNYHSTAIISDKQRVNRHRFFMLMASRTKT